MPRRSGFETVDSVVVPERLLAVALMGAFRYAAITGVFELLWATRLAS